jgi:hypothetical protein
MSNPVGCCGCPKTACLCTELPSTLHATFTNGNCTGFTSLSVELECKPSTGRWEFSGNVGSCGSFKLAFYCGSNPGSSSGCDSFNMRITSCDGSEFTHVPSPGCTCQPDDPALSVEFQVTQVGVSACPCCPIGVPTTFFITVTV